MSVSKQRNSVRSKQSNPPVPSYIKSYVKQIVRSQLDNDEELKHYPTVISPTALPSTGLVQDLSVITQGTTSLTRVGDEIRAKSLDFTVGFIGADTTNFLRCTIVRWNMNDANDALTLGDIYSTSTDPTLSQFSPTKPNRFTVLYDKAVVTGTGGTNAVIVKGHLKLNQAISYNLGANSGIDHIYMILSSDSGAVTHPTYTVEADLGYHDS